jgi:hypothetical protein
MNYEIFTIQDQSTNESIQLENGSFFITLSHGEGFVTGGNIGLSFTNEINKTFQLDFSKNGKVGSADSLTSESSKQLQVISNLINNITQNVTVNNSTSISGSGTIDPTKLIARGIMNGVIGPVNANDFGNARINTVINSLINAGANPSYLTSGTPTFKRDHEAGRVGTFIDFKINNGSFSRGTYMGNAPVNIDLGKFQIF